MELTLTCYLLNEEIDDVMIDCPVCKARVFGLTYGSLGLQEGNYVIWMCVDSCGATGVIDHKQEAFEQILKENECNRPLHYNPDDGSSFKMLKILRAKDDEDTVEINNWYINSDINFCSTVEMTLENGDIATWNPD
jgi:hypothetical protein